MSELNFDVQRFADFVRSNNETLYKGRRRLSGNYGRVYIYHDSEDAVDGEVTGNSDAIIVFELKAFSATITAEREDVWIGNSKDSKIVGYTGEGELTILQVFDRGYKEVVENWNKGHDIRFAIVGELSDPDQMAGGTERVKITNVWINELEIMKFEKGGIVEKTIPFGFTPYDLEYESVLEKTATTTTGA